MRHPVAAILTAAALVAGAATAPAASATTRSVTCVGAAQSCTATVPLAGLHKGDRVAIDLTDTDLALVSITRSRRPVQAAYGLAGLTTRLGGSQLVARFLIFRPVPKGASVRFRFAVPPRMTSCGDDGFTLAGAQVRLTDVQSHGVGCMAARRVAEGCVSGVGPGRGWVPLQVDETVILWRGRQRVTFGLGDVRASCAPSG